MIEKESGCVVEEKNNPQEVHLVISLGIIRTTIETLLLFSHSTRRGMCQIMRRGSCGVVVSRCRGGGVRGWDGWLVGWPPGCLQGVSAFMRLSTATNAGRARSGQCAAFTQMHGAVDDQ